MKQSSLAFKVLFEWIQVVANAVAALSEINEASPSGKPLIEMNAQTINKLLTALNECTEWGQVIHWTSWVRNKNDFLEILFTITTS